MIFINLLPHREMARERRKQRFLRELGAAVLLGGLVCGAIWAVYHRAVDQQQARNRLLAQAIAGLDRDIRETVALENDVAALRQHRRALEHLQAGRNLPVQLLQELALQIPEGVALSSLTQEREDVVLHGLAQSPQQVSELLHNLGNSDRLTGPQLVEIVATPPQPGAVGKDLATHAPAVARFTIRLTLSPALTAGDPPPDARGR